MTQEGIRAYMKAFFEKYYAQQRAENEIFLKRPGVPAAMLADGADSAQEWKIWKLIPVSESEYDIPQIEAKFGVSLPECVKAFFTTYHHFFEYPINSNPIGAPFAEMERVMNIQLAANGYLPFLWRDDYFMLCMDLQNMPIEESCPVLCIDSEMLWNSTDDWAMEYRKQHPEEDAEIPIIPKERLKPLMRPAADNFYAFLEGVLRGEIKPLC